ncbi:rod shape-determining protein RodA [Candidatus Roizmanbacteria bacterium]|nr:rod shape-determining protein RodA [Candidatus Roizmanbacteria bacterium]
MLPVLLASLFLSIFSFFNLFGIKRELLPNFLVYAAIGFALFFLAKKIGVSFFLSNIKFFYWLFIFLLLITYVVGVEARGSKRWIDFYFFNFQPSEFFKIFFVLFFADYFTRHKKDIEDVAVFWKSLGYFILPVFIIFKQPDLGTALVFTFTFFCIFIFSKVPKRYLLYVFFMILTISPVGWLILKEYQRQRIISFLNPELNPQGTAYNMVQAVITIGSGQFFGRGMGYGTQSRLLFLPENHTDFAFASLIEQFGLFGGLAIFVAYLIVAVVLIKRLFFYQKSRDEENNFRFLLTLGFLSYFVFQIIVNISMNLGLLPIVGIALPFISYGGSSLVSLLFALGLLF